jgi:hypothetical protein
MTTTNGPAAQAGSYRVGDLDLNRIGYGAMQLAGPGVFRAAARPRRRDRGGADRGRHPLPGHSVKRSDQVIAVDQPGLAAPPPGLPRPTSRSSRHLLRAPSQRDPVDHR